MKMTIKTGDNVVVIAGKDKGKSGKVSKVYAEENRVLVEDVNVVSKHQKPRSQQDKGGIIKKSAPIDASNVLVVCPVCKKATRVAHNEVDGKKVRVCKKCGASLDKDFVKQTKKDAKKSVKAQDLKGAKLKAVKEESKAEEKPAKKTTKATATKTAAKPAAEKTTKTTKTTAKVAEEKKETKSPKTETKTTTKKSTAAKKETK